MSFNIRLKKRVNLPGQTIIIRPRAQLKGKFALAFTLEKGNASATSRNPVIVYWCGSRYLVGFSETLSSFLTSLRFPDELNPGDVYSLTVQSYLPLTISLALHGDPAPAEGEIAFEVRDDAVPVATIAANPATTSQRRWEDSLVIGSCYMPAKQRRAQFEIAALRDFPEGAGLRLKFRPVDVPANNQLIRVAAGDMTRLCIIGKGAASTQLYLWLQPAVAGERWPLVFMGEYAFEWDGSVQRRWDTSFLPAFSLLENEPAVSG